MYTVLLDTNIIMDIEDTGRQLPPRTAEILRDIAHEATFYVHQSTYEDIEQDGNEKRKELLKSRTLLYEPLDSVPGIDRDFFKQQGWPCKDQNEFIDNTLLACVLKDAVDFLATNDKGIKTKAKQSGISDRVLNLEELHALLKAPEPKEAAIVQHKSCSTLDPDDPFFASLKEEYPGFSKWFAKCRRKHRMCWYIKVNGKLVALCIHKDKNSGAIGKNQFNPNCKMLKLCTFKVAHEFQGRKAGECLLYAAFQYAKTKQIDFIYFTIHEARHRQLMDLAQDFGFRKYGQHLGNDSNYPELVMGKFLAPQTEEDQALNKADFDRIFYPSYKNDSTVGKFLVPVQNEYHERLFPDVSQFAKSLLGDNPMMYTSESNAIRKAYLCNANIKQLEKGDLLLFYRSGKNQSVEVLGAVVDVCRLNDIDSIEEMVRNRTVYPEEEIAAMLENSTRKSLLVICFNLIRYFEKPVSRDYFSEIDLAVPQSIVQITDSQFEQIVGEGSER